MYDETFLSDKLEKEYKVHINGEMRFEDIGFKKHVKGKFKKLKEPF
jgi:hypothetical protein